MKRFYWSEEGERRLLNMDRRMEETVSRWLEEELDEDDLIESEQEEDVIEEENIVHSPHDTDTEQEDQSDDNDENAEQNHSDSDNSMPLRHYFLVETLGLLCFADRLQQC
ncbi:hypothetical protein K1T71_006308 [Dendrolimus kikuchii]|uniref:Uncharacterized protein n=1 Tax=Dendrolimus kikuchii TaxID=765133 RepID=A0ACC1D3N5_9NEOP|nr:hypothetical protein K1T71_006308 [Dendrolimus kikuchii]